jgi:hypothetical protein
MLFPKPRTGFSPQDVCRQPEIPVDGSHGMSPADSRALENACEALELVVPTAEHWFAAAATSDWLKTLGGTAVASETSLADGLIDTPIGTASTARRTRTTAVRYFSDRLLRSPSIPARPNRRTRAKLGKRDRSWTARSAAGRPPSDSSLSTRATHARFRQR